MATTINRAPLTAKIDDDGSNTVGSIVDKAFFTTVVMDPIDAAFVTLDAADATKAPLASPALTGVPTAPTAAVATNTTQLATTAFVLANAGGGSVVPSVCEGRLTLESGVAVSTTDQTAKTNVYFTPYQGNRISLYSGTAWVAFTFTEKTLALGTLTTDLPYDVFAYDSAGAVTLELLAWTSKTARATALVLQDGVLCKTGALTRRYLGTFHTTTTTTTEDSLTKRLLWNCYNRVTRPVVRAEGTDTWTYTTATVRQANGSTANQIAVVQGVAEEAIDLGLVVLALNASASSAAVGIGEDVTNAFTAGGTFALISLQAGSLQAQIVSHLTKIPPVGYHFYSWNEYSAAVGTTTWYGDGGGALIQSGLIGTWRS